MLRTLGSTFILVIANEVKAGSSPQVIPVNSTKPVFAECNLKYDSPNNAPKDGAQPTEGYFRMKQTYGGSLVLSGYSKYLPKSETAYALKVHLLPIDEYHDCSSSGALDTKNSANDIDIL